MTFIAVDVATDYQMMELAIIAYITQIQVYPTNV